MRVICVELSLLDHTLLGCMLTWAFLSSVSSWERADLSLMFLCTGVLSPF